MASKQRIKGFTMVEIMVALALTATVMALTSVLLIATLNQTEIAAARAHTEQQIDGILDFLGDRMRYSVSIDGSTDITSPDSITGVLFVGNGGVPDQRGYLYYGRPGTSELSQCEEVFSADYLTGGVTIGLKVEQVVNTSHKMAVTLTVDAYNPQGTQVLTRSRSFELRNSPVDDTRTPPGAAPTTIITSPELIICR